LSESLPSFPEIVALTPAEFDQFPGAVHQRVCEPFENNLDASCMPIEGLALRSLPSIALSDRSVLPFVWLYVQHRMRRWEVEPMLNARVVVSDVLLGQVHAIPLLMQNGALWSPAAFASRKGPPPEGEDLGGSTCTAESGKLAELPPGRYAMTAMVYDWKSNTVVADVTAKPGALQPLAATPLAVAARRMATLNRLTADGVEFSGAARDAPALVGHGLAVRVVPRADKHATVLGRLRMAAAEAAAVVPHSDPAIAHGFAWVTFMLVKLDELGVVTRAVQVPLSTDASSLVGQFAVPLEAIFDVELDGHLLYVVAGRYIEGALAIAAG